MRARRLLPAAGLVPLLGLMLAHFTNDFYSNFLPVLAPLLKERLDLNHTMVGILAATYMATGSFLQLVFGHISDRLRTWRFVLIGPMVTGVFMSLLGVMPSYEWILVALVVAALGTAMFHPQGSSTAGRLFNSNRGLIVSLFIASGSLGFSAGPLLLALFVDQNGLESTPLAIIPLIISGIIIWFLQRGIIFGDDSPSPSTQAPSKPVIDSIFKKHFSAFGVLWGLVVVRHAILLAFVTYFLILMTERGMGYLAGSLVLFIMLLAGVVGTMLGGFLSDRYGRWKTAIISILGGFVFTLGFFVFPEGLGFLALLIGKALLNASNPIMVAHAQEIAPGSSSTASALVMGFGWGFGGLLVVLVGVLADATHIAHALWISTWVALGLSALLILLGTPIFKREQRPAN